MNILERYAAMDYGPAPEARNEADTWLAGRDFSKALFIAGEWRAAALGKSFTTEDPATGKQLATISDAGDADIEAAVAAARRALPKWQAASGYARARVLYAIGRAMQRHQRLFAVLESLDNGKPIRESRDIDVPLAIRHFLHHAGWAQVLEREFPGHKAAGVVGQIIPWNFPLLMLAWKIAPALAAGCTVVLKPAEFTPLTAILFAEICEKVGVPKGVVNIVPGGPNAGAAIVNHPDVDKIAFTGSSEVGKIIRKATAGSGKKISLELGGKSAFVVFEDADLDSAVEGLVDGIWFNQGQVCCAGSRLLVQEGVSEALFNKIKTRMSRLRLGSPLDKNTDIGPLVAAIQRERVSGLVKEGQSQGADLLAAGQCAALQRLFLSADARHVGRACKHPRAGRGVRPSAGCDDLPQYGGSGRAGQQHALRPCRLGVEREHQSRAPCRAAAQGGRGVDQWHQYVRRFERLRRLP